MNWKPVVGYEGKYEVSDTGLVRTLPGQGKVRKILKPWAVLGYAKVNLYNGSGKRKHYRVHRLVLEAFVGPCPEGYVACHNNGDEQDNRLENLRWGTQKDNVQDTIRHGRHNWQGRKNLRP